MSKVFFDMDGTLNVWALGDHIDEVSAPGYMRSRTPIDTTIEASRLLHEMGLEVWIVSAVLPYSHSVPDKNHWIEQHCPWISRDHRRFPFFGENKAFAMEGLAEPGDVFLDDYTANLEALERTLGDRLTCVKVLNGINDTHHSWHGKRISIFSDAEAIAETVEAFSMAGKAVSAGKRVDPTQAPIRLQHVFAEFDLPLPLMIRSEAGTFEKKKALSDLNYLYFPAKRGFWPAQFLFDAGTMSRIVQNLFRNRSEAAQGAWAAVSSDGSMVVFPKTISHPSGTKAEISPLLANLLPESDAEKGSIFDVSYSGNVGVPKRS